MTFHEILARTALNQVADESTTVPGRWTSNPYRGCSHARTFCYARTTDRYLDLNTGEDIDNQIVVKTNLVDVLRREPATSRARLHPCAPRWPPVGFVDGRKTTAFGFGLSREAPAPASEEQHGLF